MTTLKERIALAKANAPFSPLIASKKQLNEEIILIEAAKSESLVDKFLKYRQRDAIENDKNKFEAFKWIKMKSEMVTIMENKRDEEWQSEMMKATAVKHEEEEEEEEIGVEDDGEDKGSQVSNKETGDDVDSSESDHEAEAADSDVDEEEVVEESQGNDVNDDSEDDNFVGTFKKRNTRIISDDEDEEASGENLDISDDPSDISFDRVSLIDSNVFNQIVNPNDPIDYYLAQQQCSSSQVPLSYSDDECSKSNQSDEQLFAKPFPIDSEIPNKPLEISDFSQESLANLCSGVFQDTSDQEEDDHPKISINDDSDRENVEEEDHDTSDIEENTEVTSESDNENEQDDLSKVMRKRRLKRVARSFFEDEAELSGSEADVSSDEDEGEEENEYQLEEIQEELPSDDELQQQIEKIHNKELLDEDKRQLMILKERFFDDGDLHGDGLKDRKKKFRWNLNGYEEDEFNVLTDSDDDGNDSQSAVDSSDDESRDGDCSKTIRLRTNFPEQVVLTSPPKPLLTTTIEMVGDSNEIQETEEAKDAKKLAQFNATAPTKKPFDPSVFKLKKVVDKTVETKISSFFSPDFRPTEVWDKSCSSSSKRSLNSTSNDLNSKRFKNCPAVGGVRGKSIFDLL